MTEDKEVQANKVQDDLPAWFKPGKDIEKSQKGRSAEEISRDVAQVAESTHQRLKEEAAKRPANVHLFDTNISFEGIRSIVHHRGNIIIRATPTNDKYNKHSANIRDKVIPLHRAGVVLAGMENFLNTLMTAKETDRSNDCKELNEIIGMLRARIGEALAYRFKHAVSPDAPYL